MLDKKEEKIKLAETNNPVVTNMYHKLLHTIQSKNLGEFILESHSSRH